MHQLLLSSPYLLLFTVIGAGYVLGRINLGGLHLNVAAVLFVGLAFGAWDKRFQIPEQVQMLGLILYIYAIGLQAGPIFFTVFRERGLRFNLLAIGTLAFSFLVTLVVGRVIGVPSDLLAGLFTGGLTNTPALAAATDALRQSCLAAGQATEDCVIGPTLGYSVSYPFGVLGVILAIRLLTSRWGIAFGAARETARQRGESGEPAIEVHAFRVENERLFGTSLRENELGRMTGLVFTRLHHGPFTTLATLETILQQGDLLVGVGSAEAISKATALIGPCTSFPLDELTMHVQYHDLQVLNRELAGRKVLDLNADSDKGFIVTRVRRGPTLISITTDTTLEYGDIVRIVSYVGRNEQIERLFGNSVRDLTETDYLSVSLGVVAGLLIGMIPFPIPGNGAAGQGVFRLGLAGGPLLAGLILGWYGRLGPIIWTLPPNASLTLRQLGLHLFLAGVGLKAGGHVMPVLQTHGFDLLAAGTVITLSSALSAMIIGYRWLKIEPTELLGVVSGIHTQPAVLAFSCDLSGSTVPNSSYAAVQPVCLMSKIILAQVLALWA